MQRRCGAIVASHEPGFGTSRRGAAKVDRNRGMADVDRAAPSKFDLSVRAPVLMTTCEHLARLRHGGTPDVVNVRDLSGFEN